MPHLLVGGRSFHNRAEVEALRAALAAIERPDDELSVFATLRGPFFGIADEELLQYKHRYGRLNPFQAVELSGAPARATAIVGEALALIRDAAPAPEPRARRGDDRPAAREATRAHVRFALEHSGEQVLANVLRVADLARQFEAEGGISFRGFLEELDTQAEEGQAEEAPILEEGSDGVRLMTVHKAKGLEFPVVILGDMTAKLRPAIASRYLDSESSASARFGWPAARPPTSSVTAPMSWRATRPKACASPTSPPPAPATCSSSPPSATRNATAGSRR